MLDGGFQLYLQRVADGVLNGFLYGMVALALVLVFKATGVINFAQGAMGMVGTFLAFTFAEKGACRSSSRSPWPWWCPRARRPGSSAR